MTLDDMPYDTPCLVVEASDDCCLRRGQTVEKISVAGYDFLACGSPQSLLKRVNSRFWLMSQTVTRQLHDLGDVLVEIHKEI